MVSTAPQCVISNLALTGEQRVVIYELDWQSYQQILVALPQKRRARLIYDQGTLELTMPSEAHDFFSRMIGLFIRILVEEFGFKIKTIGSTTMNYPALKKGSEADEAFYIQNQPRVAGRTVDFAADPPPDLVVEIDISHTDINKNRFYARIGVPEFWRFNGKTLRIYQLQNGEYIEVETSPTFPELQKSRLYEFLEQCWDDEIEACNALRAWVRQELQSK